MSREKYTVTLHVLPKSIDGYLSSGSYVSANTLWLVNGFEEETSIVGLNLEYCQG